MEISFFRGRRLRQSPEMRRLMREVVLTKDNLVMPYFLVDTPDPNYKKPIPSMPGQYQFSLKAFEKHLESIVDKGLHSVILFGIPKKKNASATEAYSNNGIVQQAVRMIKKRWSHLIVITDVCLCEYTDHGHCGLIKPSKRKNQVLVDNDETLELLARVALSHAEAGADIIAPSDMMDGRIITLRSVLDEADQGFENIPIMSYAVKYASAYYGPFRDAAESAPQKGDRKSYQMDYSVIKEAIREADADIQEGADIIIVKPAGPYQDIIHTLSAEFDTPIAGYQVSGEYSMIKAAAQNNWIDENAVILESLTGIKRAGAQIIISYFTEDIIKNSLI